MAAKQHKYTASVQVTENVARVIHIMMMPQQELVEITYAIGEETGGTFVQTDTRSRIVSYATLPAAVQTVLQDLETRALTYGVAQALFPAGTEEDVP